MGGSILTFYSYKGGTGRSMAVANAAWLLASKGFRVLAVDWDLEAPGLHRYFQPFLPDPNLTVSPGVIDLVWRFAEATMDAEAPDEPGWHDELARISPYAMSIEYGFPDAGTIDFVPAGRQDATYSALVTQFDWNNFYDRLGGGGFLEALKRNMRDGYDYVLIDSRTGLSDTAGICTVQLPDILVNCFSLSNQAIHGAEAVAASVSRQRQNSDLRIFPVPMRVEDGEQDKLEASRDYARTLFGRYLTHLADPERYWGEVEVPYKSFYAYEEILATIGDRPRQENTILAATERIVGYLTDGRVTELATVPPESDRRTLLARFQRTGPQDETIDSRSPAGGPRVFLSYAYESADHFDAVRELWYLLRAGGIDARLDLPPAQRRDDWPAWVREELNAAELVLVIASAAYRAAAELEGTEGVLGPAVDLLRRRTHRALGVVLPGTSAHDLPEFFGMAEHVVIEDISVAGVEPLRQRVISLVAPKSSTAAPSASRSSVPGRVASPELTLALQDLASRGRLLLRKEAAVRSLFDPLPIPTSWSETQRPVASLASQVGSGLPIAIRLSGRSSHLGDAFRQLPRARLVMLGAPGSGKTTAMIKLALDLLATRSDLEPVPVLLSPVSWQPMVEPFASWIVRRLEEDYPELTDARRYGPDAARRLVEAGLIMPVVDGLDELPAVARSVALRRLVSDADLPMVVTSRTEEYQVAVDDAGLVLPGAAAVELTPIRLDDVINYLTLAQPINDQRWQRVFEELRNNPEHPLADLLSTPPMVTLVRSAYSTSDTEPTELLDRVRFPTTESLREHLLSTFVPASYQQQLPTGLAKPWQRVDPASAHRWLAHLARSLDLSGSYDLAWWQLHRLVPRGTIQVILGFAGFLLTAFVLGVQAVVYDQSRWLATLVAGLAVGLAAAALSARSRAPVRPVLRLDPPGRVGRLPRLRLRAYVDQGWARGPRQTLRSDKIASLVTTVATVVYAIAAGAPLATFGALPLRSIVALASVLITSQIVFQIAVSAWAQFSVARYVLALRGQLPLRLMSFLEDAYRRGILRQVGSVYQFRHADLQRHLAATYPVHQPEQARA